MGWHGNDGTKGFGSVMAVCEGLEIQSCKWAFPVVPLLAVQFLKLFQYVNVMRIE